MKNIANMDYEESIKYEDKLDNLYDSLEAVTDDLEDTGLEEEIATIRQVQSEVDKARKKVQEQRRLNEEASEMQRDTLSDLENEQK